MGTFSETHNLTNWPEGNWRSLHGYGSSYLAYGRLFLAGYNLSLNLWRDAKYDGVLEVNRVPFRLEIKSSGMWNDPLENNKAIFGFVSGARSGMQIDRTAASRAATIDSDDADFAIGISSHDGTIWTVPVELLPIIGNHPKVNRMDIFKEKVGVFKGLDSTDFNSRAILEGFSSKDETCLEEICNKYNIPVTNSSKASDFRYKWQPIKGVRPLMVDYKRSLVLDIWNYIFQKVGASDEN